MTSPPTSARYRRSRCTRHPWQARTRQRTRHPPRRHLRTGPAVPVTGALASLGALRFRLITTRADSQLYNDLIAAHHYLGYTPLAGSQLRYLVQAERAGIIAALGFAASAWKCAARDTHICWNAPTRETPVKDIYRYPPHRDWQRIFTQGR